VIGSVRGRIIDLTLDKMGIRVGGLLSSLVKRPATGHRVRLESITLLKDINWKKLDCFSLSRAYSSVTSDLIDKKLEHFTKISPTPISIAEFIERGQASKMSEAESYTHLVHEGLVRLSHMVSEVRQFPKELAEQEDYERVLSEYLITYTKLLEFENKEADAKNIRKAVDLLIDRKAKHKDTVPSMASACMAMKEKYGVSLDEEDCALTKSVQYCLDRLYISRISLNMLTNQHLMVHGYKNPIKHQIGVINPQTDLESVVRHAYSDARFLCEQCYIAAPKLELKTHNLTSPDQRVSVVHVPSHIYHMSFEVMKNAMQATVNTNWDSLDHLPPINVLICQSDADITIKISDTGGGVTRATSEKMFKYLYTTAPKASLTKESVPLSGLGYGLPLARLYARYFQGDIKAASYENHGTDIYIYLRALAKESVEQLPIWSDTASNKIAATSSDISDWTSTAQGYRAHPIREKKMSYCFSK